MGKVKNPELLKLKDKILLERIKIQSDYNERKRLAREAANRELKKDYDALDREKKKLLKELVEEKKQVSKEIRKKAKRVNPDFDFSKRDYNKIGKDYVPSPKKK